MIFLRQNLIYRVLIFFLILGAILIAIPILIPKEYLTLKVIVGILVLLILFSIFIFWYLVSRPLRAILQEMRALLTGKNYQKIFTKRIDEIGVIAHFFNEVTKNLEKVSGQIKEEKRMFSELQIASQIQKEILPKSSPNIKGLDIVAKTRPAVELGGDTFDFVTIKDNTFLYVGDVTGHGVPAGIVMTIVYTLIHTFVEIYDNAYEVLVQTNRRLKMHIKSTMFMTLIMLRWNSKEKKMTFVGAGHEHLLIFRAKSETCEVKMAGGIALGMIPDNSKIIKEVDLELEKNDVVILYSDGITEAKNMAGEMFGLERLKKTVEAYAAQYSAEGIVFHVARDFSAFVQEHIQEDDMTLMAIKYLGDEEVKVEISEEQKKSTKW